MTFSLQWTDSADKTYKDMKAKAEKTYRNRKTPGKTKSSKDEGLFKQVNKTVLLLQENPRHSGLHTHAYDSIDNPYDKDEKVFEAYAQNNTPGAYRVFWCYGPGKNEITILAITAHP
jgi:hypothetical protein